MTKETRSAAAPDLVLSCSLAACGDQLINVSVQQGNGLAAETVKDMMLKLLELSASKA